MRLRKNVVDKRKSLTRYGLVCYQSKATLYNMCTVHWLGGGGGGGCSAMGDIIICVGDIMICVWVIISKLGECSVH